MNDDHGTIRRTFAGTAVVLAFAFLMGVWLFLGRLPDSLLALLYPVWLPSYLAFVAASSLRAAAFPWLGSGPPFRVVLVLFTYVEAVLLAGLFRLLRNAYRTYRRGRERDVSS